MHAGRIRKARARSLPSARPNNDGGGTLVPFTPPVTESQCVTMNSTMKWAARVAMAR